MIPKFRIIETNKGWIVEYLEVKLFTKKWKPYITYYGLKEAYPFSKEKDAFDSLMEKIKDEIHRDRLTVKINWKEND